MKEQSKQIFKVTIGIIIAVWLLNSALAFADRTSSDCAEYDLLSGVRCR